MSKNSVLIAPVNAELNSSERGLLGSMLNVAEYDYKNISELCNIFEADSKEKIIGTVNELCSKGYLVKIGDIFAVNKLLIPSMKVVRGVKYADTQKENGN